MKRILSLIFIFIIGVALEGGQSPEIIAFLGQKGVGKDTAADYFVRNYSFRKYPLADPIKKATQLLFHFSDEQLWGDLKDTVDPYWGATPREVLQFIGIDTMGIGIEERFPHIGKSYHILSLNLWLKQHPNERIVISDLRMQADVDQLRAMDALIIGILRPSIGSNDSHESEANIPNIMGVDHWLVNDGTVDQFEEKIRVLVESYHVAEFN